jgi:hypothetical protein
MCSISCKSMFTCSYTFPRDSSSSLTDGDALAELLEEGGRLGGDLLQVPASAQVKMDRQSDSWSSVGVRSQVDLEGG